MAKDNTKDRPSLLPRPASSNKEEREEGGTPDILGSVRLGLAVQMKEQLGRRGLTVSELGPGFGLVLVLPPFVLAVLFVSTDMGSMSVHGYCCRGFGLFGDLVLSVAFYSFLVAPALA